MKRIFALCSCLVFATTAVLLSSCDSATTPSAGSESKPKITSTIVGVWHNSEGAVEVTFNADGTGISRTVKNGTSKFSSGFVYEILSEGNLRITEDRAIDVEFLKFWLSVDGNSLTMVNKKSDTTTFERGPLSPSAVNVDTTTIPWNTAITYGTLKDVRDGKSYRTVKIGSQTWMAEDLAFDTVGAHWDAMAEAWGYPWSMAMGIDSRYDSADWTSTDRRKGVCPAGWHLPSLSEWKTLIAFAGGDSTAGSALKSTAGWYDNGNGLDNLGFRVLSSSKHYGGNDTLLGTSTLYWASTATSSTTSSWIASFYSWRPAVETGYGSRESGFHVRCIQD